MLIFFIGKHISILKNNRIINKNVLDIWVGVLGDREKNIMFENGNSTYIKSETVPLVIDNS